MAHSNTVNLGAWQKPGLDYLASLPAAQQKPVLMDEFNSASCGGVPESNMFGVGLWSADYALQMASVGYTAAYLHTREHGVSYNIWDPPAGPAGAAGAWTTNTNWYAMLAVTEALGDPNGSRVVDLNVANSVSDPKALTAGYAVYDAMSSNVHSIVLFNYANASAAGTDFALPAAFFGAGSDSVLVRYLSAPTATETTNITWGNLTYAGVADGNAVQTQTQWPDKTYSCTGGCTVSVPGPGLAVVFAGGVPDTTSMSANGTSSNGTSTHAGSPSPSPSTTSPPGGKNQSAANAAAHVNVHSLSAFAVGVTALFAMLL